MASRTRPKKPTKKAAAKKTAAKKAVNSNSKIQSAQKAAQDSLRGQGDADKKKREREAAAKAEADRNTRLAKYASNQPNPTKLEPRTTTPMANSGRGVDQEQVAQRDIGTAASQAAQKIAGLAMGLRDKKEQEKEVKAQAASKQKYEAANPSLYGVSTAKRAANLAERITAVDATIQQQRAKGNAVFMGMDPNAPTVKIRRSGPERMDEFGETTEEQKAKELILTKDQLLSWLSDEAKVTQIKAAAEKAGFSIESYDDISKLWTAVVSQAAMAYSEAGGGQKVTPWALISLRGKYLVNGKPSSRVTTSTSIDEMAPEQARLMFEDTATKMLGRTPTKQELDDFIAKAQTISKANPAITKTTHNYDVAGNEVSQVSKTTGGRDVVAAKAQVALTDQLRQSEDYAAFQAAGNYFPMLFEALQSPV